MNILLKTLFFSFIKKEIISSNLKIGAKYEWIVSDDSNYTLQWNNDRTVTLAWDNIIFDKIIESIIVYYTLYNLSY